METPKNSHAFFCNRDCQYFPCHSTAKPEQFNCLFCYCPLYALDDKCGGNVSYTENGIKDCSACLLPHSPGAYDHILKTFPKIVEMMQENRAYRAPKPD